jgi:nucleoside-diphosphate-sugar epimerase
MRRVLVTGATGFVGHTLCYMLAQSGYRVRAALRSDRTVAPGVPEGVVVGEIGAATDWAAALTDVDCVVHVAARAHVLYDSRTNSDLYIETNAHGTRCLASAAAGAGVGRFVYLSSAKVNGEETINRPYTAFDKPRPCDAYGTSKWLGEQSVREIASRTGLEAAIVRSPLVYGPGVRANFLRMMRWVDSQWPLPLGAITNRRSLVSIWNLCDLLVHLLSSPVAPGRTWMVSDGEDLSTPELIRRIARAMHRRVRLLYVPVGLLHVLGGLAGRKPEIHRLSSSLELDITQTRDELGWLPPLSVDEAMARTVSWYLTEYRSHGD